MTVFIIGVVTIAALLWILRRAWRMSLMRKNAR